MIHVQYTKFFIVFSQQFMHIAYGLRCNNLYISNTTNYNPIEDSISIKKKIKNLMSQRTSLYNRLSLFLQWYYVSGFVSHTKKRLLFLEWAVSSQNAYWASCVTVTVIVFVRKRKVIYFCVSKLYLNHVENVLNLNNYQCR